MKKPLFLGFLVVAAIAGAVLIVINNNKSEVALENPSNQNLPDNSVVSKISPTLPVDGSGQATSTKKVEASKKSIYPPYAGQPILFFGNDPIISQLPPASVENYKKDLATMAEALNKDPYNFNNWLSVGIFKKFFNDYEGARDAWEYAAMLIPQQPVIHINLANLYGYYLKDFSKAEKNYLEAALIDVKNIYGALSGIAGFYRDFGFKEKALEYYRKALQVNPNDSSAKTEIERLLNG